MYVCMHACVYVKKFKKNEICKGALMAKITSCFYFFNREWMGNFAWKTLGYENLGNVMHPVAI